MLDNNIQNNTQNENEKVVQNGIQNVHQKFTARQNELRLYIINFTIDNKRPYNLESDKEVTLQVLQMDEQEYEEIIQCLIDKDGMVVDEEAKNVNFIYPVSSLETNHRVTLADGREFTAMCAIDAMGAAFTFHQDTEVHSVCTEEFACPYISIRGTCKLGRIMLKRYEFLLQFCRIRCVCYRNGAGSE